MAEPQPDDWFIERGIAETRALLTIKGQIIAAKMLWPDEMFAGQTIAAKLTQKPAGGRRGTATCMATGREILVDHLPANLTQGQTCNLIITRAPIAERKREKKAQGRFTTDPADAPWLSGARETLEFASGCWEDIWEAASSGEVQFSGGSLLFSVTPAMTVIDVDGEGSPRELALAAIPAISRWLRLFDLGGNIGIDFPTLQAKADRRAVDEALGKALIDWPHERTAMNGFGFVQLVARLEGPSLLHRFVTSRVGLCARYALRVAERAQGDGAVLLLTVHPALNSKLKPQWIEELARRTGRQVRIETDPSVALEAPHAQIVQP